MSEKTKEQDKLNIEKSEDSKKITKKVKKAETEKKSSSSAKKVSTKTSDKQKKVATSKTEKDSLSSKTSSKKAKTSSTTSKESTTEGAISTAPKKSSVKSTSSTEKAKKSSEKSVAIAGKTKTNSEKSSASAEKSKKSSTKSASKSSTAKKATKSKAEKTKKSSAKTNSQEVSKNSVASKVSKEKKSSAKSKSKTAKKTSTSKTRKKLSLAKPSIENENTKPHFEAEYYDLPYSYNQTTVKLLAQTPKTLFIYWEISEEDRNFLKQTYGENFFEVTKPVLIVYNDTLGYSFEVDINDFANSWYLHVNDSKCSYRIELGRRPIPQANSNQISTNNSDTDVSNVTYKYIPYYIYISSSNSIESPNNRVLLDSLKSKTLTFRNIKTGKVTKKNIIDFAYEHNLEKFNIEELYEFLAIIKNGKFDFNNPSSGNTSSRFL